MQATLIEQGFTLMLVGMGTVFAFLSILVAAISLMATLARRFTPLPEDDGVSEEEIAVITAAIQKYRKTNR